MVSSLLSSAGTFVARRWRTSRLLTSDTILNNPEEHEASHQILNDGNTHALFVINGLLHVHNILGKLAQVILSKLINAFLENQNSSFNFLGIISFPVLFLVFACKFLRHACDHISDIFGLLPEYLLFRLDVSQDCERVIGILRDTVEGEVKARD